MSVKETDSFDEAVSIIVANKWDDDHGWLYSYNVCLLVYSSVLSVTILMMSRLKKCGRKRRKLRTLVEEGRNSPLRMPRESIPASRLNHDHNTRIIQRKTLVQYHDVKFNVLIKYDHPHNSTRLGLFVGEDDT